MFFKVLFTVFGSVFLFSSVIIVKNKSDMTEVENSFRKYIEKYKKNYTKPLEYNLRFDAYKMNVAKINQLNTLRQNNLSAHFGVTKFSDLSTYEFTNDILVQDYTQYLDRHKHKVVDKPNESLEESKEIFDFNGNNNDEIIRYKRSVNLRDEIPKKLDWREKGVVSAVNNQGRCGACWAFSIIETLESMRAIQTNNTVQQLSVQQAIDCAGYTNNGCQGGDMCVLLEYMQDTGMRILPATEYPLHLRTERCQYESDKERDKIGVGVSTFDCDSLLDSEDALLTVLALHGPLAVAVNALLWQNYQGGIIQHHCTAHPLLLNHAVQLVGYDLEAPIPYYIARNSWGVDWGENGYVRLAVGGNMCGLALEVVAVTVEI